MVAPHSTQRAYVALIWTSGVPQWLRRVRPRRVVLGIDSPLANVLFALASYVDIAVARDA